ncbi:hypothetical protein CLOSTHATH_06215, partial [Hungatella hathewayi DSM 13479]
MLLSSYQYIILERDIQAVYASYEHGIWSERTVWQNTDVKKMRF